MPCLYCQLSPFYPGLALLNTECQVLSKKDILRRYRKVTNNDGMAGCRTCSTVSRNPSKVHRGLRPVYRTDYQSHDESACLVIPDSWYRPLHPPCLELAAMQSMLQLSASSEHATLEPVLRATPYRSFLPSKQGRGFIIGKPGGMGTSPDQVTDAYVMPRSATIHRFSCSPQQAQT